MAKKSTERLFEKDIPITFNLSHVVSEEFIRQAIDSQVEKAVEHAVSDAVSEAVTALVDKIGQARIAKEIERVMAEGWPMTNEYGEARGSSVTIKDRISKLLNSQDRYSGRGTYIEETVKRQVDETLNKTLKADIDAARNKFKAEVDAVLTATIREALAKNLGLKA